MILGSADPVIPFKGRKIDWFKRVEVYRNLNKKSGPWYSIRQGGKVVGHAKSISLYEVYFNVNGSGRKRYLKTGQRNVHAYILGYGYDRFANKFDLGSPLTGRYNPKKDGKFKVRRNSKWKSVISAMAAGLDGSGLSVWMPRA